VYSDSVNSLAAELADYYEQEILEAINGPSRESISAQSLGKSTLGTSNSLIAVPVDSRSSSTGSKSRSRSKSKSRLLSSLFSRKRLTSILDEEEPLEFNSIFYAEQANSVGVF
jgi:hypothetical protein